MKRIFALAALSLFSVNLAIAAEVTPVMDKGCEPPKYPKASLMNEETGSVVVGLLISADGKVVDTRVDKSSGFKSLDRAATTGFSACKFKPGTKDGKVEQIWTKVQFDWSLS